MNQKITMVEKSVMAKQSILEMPEGFSKYYIDVDASGRLTSLPVKRKKRLMALSYLADRIPAEALIAKYAE